MPNKVVHFEIPADDLDRAQKFYGDAFVSTVPTNAEGMPTESGGINGDMLRRQDPVRNVTIVVGVDDIDATLEKIVHGGGKVVREKRSVGPGCAAYFQDSEGNVVGLFQPFRPTS
jgi:uncharacterized protein